MENVNDSNSNTSQTNSENLIASVIFDDSTMPLLSHQIHPPMPPLELGTNTTTQSQHPIHPQPLLPFHADGTQTNVNIHPPSVPLPNMHRVAPIVPAGTEIPQYFYSHLNPTQQQQQQTTITTNAANTNNNRNTSSYIDFSYGNQSALYANFTRALQNACANNMEQPSPANNTGNNNTGTTAATNNPTNTPTHPSDQHATNTNSSNPNTSNTTNPSSQSSNQSNKPPPPSSSSRKGRKGSAEKAWVEKFKMLEEFYAINGHSDVPQTYAKNKALGKWVGKQREHYKTYIQNQASENSSNDSSNDSSNASTTESTKDSTTFEANSTNTSNTTSTNTTNPTSSKSKKKSCPLTLARIQKLSTLDFKFTIGKGKYAQIHGIFCSSDNMKDKWEDKYQELKRFQLAFGHLDVKKVEGDGDDSGDSGAGTLNMKISLEGYGSSSEKECSVANKNTPPLPSTTDTTTNASTSVNANQASINQGNRTLFTSERLNSLARWVTHQRKKYMDVKVYKSISSSQILEERFQRLTDIGFEFVRENGGNGPEDGEEGVQHRKPSSREIWQIRYKELCEYAKVHGTTNVPISYKENPSLARWVSTQRSEMYKMRQRQQECQQVQHPSAVVSNNSSKSTASSKHPTSSLSDERVQLLESIGFEFSIPEMIFANHVQELKDYSAKHGHMECKEIKKLYSWVKRQRSYFRDYMEGRGGNSSNTSSNNSNPMTNERIVQLEEIGFDWKYNFRELDKDVVMEKSKTQSIGVVKTQNKSSSSSDNCKELDTNAEETNNNTKDTTDANSSQLHPLPEHLKGTKPEVWIQHYSELVEFQKTNGHTRVPGRFAPNPKLGNWVKLQREDYKHKKEKKPSPMNDYRILMLNQIGFEWSVYPINERKNAWDKKFLDLQAFKEQFGNCDVPQTYKGNPSLGRWCSKQRDSYRCFKDDKPSSINQERISRLEAIGFRFFIGKGNSLRSWDQYFADLKEFVQMFGHANVPLGYKNDPQLSRWAYQQKVNFLKMSKGKNTNGYSITPQRVDKLVEIGFKFHSEMKVKNDIHDADYRKRSNDSTLSNDVDTMKMSKKFRLNEGEIDGLVDISQCLSDGESAIDHTRMKDPPVVANDYNAAMN